MKKDQTATVKEYRPFSQMQCIATFLAIIVPVVGITVYLLYSNPTLLSLLLFIEGWFTYTFVEYMVHRFWMHDRMDNGKVKQGVHALHHRHPHQIAITPTIRAMLIVGNLALLAASIIWLPAGFMYLTGFCTGFVTYTFMHYIIHQSWSKKIFPGLIRAHIMHHLRYPNRYFGVQLTIWDRVFGTIANEAEISPRVIDFYFNGKNKELSLQ